jgi:hypothetical protein
MKTPAKRFEDLVVWQKAHQFVLAAYRLSRTFPRSETYGLSSQFRRAAVSIAANSAEGFRCLSLAEVVSTIVLLVAVLPLTAMGADSEEELAKATLNPVAALISLPLQNNWDFGIGPADAMRYTLNVQPVIPFSLTSEYNLITRTIVPYIYAEAPVKGGDNESGLGDIVQSFFLSPKAPVGGWIVGAGPVFLYPTASNDMLGSEKWGAGPTGVALKQDSGFTYGLLFNHIWSFTGDEERANVSSTFLQPFFSYTTKTYTTFGVNTESTYDWKNSQWIVPINATATQMLKIGGQPLTVQLGYRYYADAPDGGPDWGLRFAITFLFPKV